VAEKSLILFFILHFIKTSLDKQQNNIEGKYALRFKKFGIAHAY